MKKRSPMHWCGCDRKQRMITWAGAHHLCSIEGSRCESVPISNYFPWKRWMAKKKNNKNRNNNNDNNSKNKNNNNKESRKTKKEKKTESARRARWMERGTFKCTPNKWSIKKNERIRNECMYLLKQYKFIAARSRLLHSNANARILTRTSVNTNNDKREASKSMDCAYVCVCAIVFNGERETERPIGKGTNGFTYTQSNFSASMISVCERNEIFFRISLETTWI